MRNPFKGKKTFKSLVPWLGIVWNGDAIILFKSDKAKPILLSP